MQWIDMVRSYNFKKAFYNIYQLIEVIEVPM